MAESEPRDLFPGALEMMVLRLLKREPMHGYALVQRIQQASRNLLQVEEGSLYPALHRMEQHGWIAAEWQMTPANRRARVYRLTRAGETQLAEQREKWARLTKGVSKVLRFA